MEILGNSEEKKNKMCGIAGFVGAGNERALTEMIQSIRYRGPNIQDSIILNNVGLAHARLSILDLRPEGNQPMFSQDKSLCITFNGEIYNYLELKKDLEGKYKFNSSTDTEVLLYLYKEYGIGMLDKINGMFVFAISDFCKNSVFIAKDRMGKKPLYYTSTKNSFVFASELKAVLKHPSVGKELNVEAVNQYLTFDYVPTPNSIIKGVYKLDAGEYLVVKNNKIEKKQKYWNHDFSLKTNLSFENATQSLDNLLNEAVKIRLMSDVPLGVFLSGGLDSSAVAYYAQKNSIEKVKTFSIGFEDKSYDETDYAARVASHLGTDHHSKILNSKETLELLDEIIHVMDEPFADASLIPTYFLSKYTKQYVTVALGGDGSDEMLAGYPTFISDKFKHPLSIMPSVFSKMCLNLVNHVIPVSDKNISFDFKIKQYLRGFFSQTNHIHQLWLGSFTPNEKKSLFNTEVYRFLKDKSGLGKMDNIYNDMPIGWSDFEKTTYSYYKTYLLDDILVKVDRASMYNSLEVRAPFLDKNVVEFTNSLPRRFKQKGLNGKFILKKIMEDKLPNDIVYRPKKGFGIPLSDWIRKDLKLKIEEVLLTKDQLFNQDYIHKLIVEHSDKKNNHRKLIWNLFILKNYLIKNEL